MEHISEDEFNAIKVNRPEKKELGPELSKSQIDKMIVEMENPVDAQKELAVQIKIFLDQRIAREMEEKGYLTDNTRRWVDSYNTVLEKIQKALHGDKSVSLHLHKVTHSQIAAKMRDVKKKDKKKEEEDIVVDIVA